jgi:hypothetical protein
MLRRNCLSSTCVISAHLFRDNSPDAHHCFKTPHPRHLRLQLKRTKDDPVTQKDLLRQMRRDAARNFSAIDGVASLSEFSF